MRAEKIGGKFQILVVEGGGKYEKEELSKIKFKIGEKKKFGGSVLVRRT